MREIAVALLLALTVLLLYLANAMAPQVADDALDSPADRLELRLQAQYEVGIRQLLGSDRPSEAELPVSLDDLATTPRERIALVAVHRDLSREPDALENAIGQLALFAYHEDFDPAIQKEALTFAELLREPADVSAERREEMLATYGWFARLAIDRATALSEARQVAQSVFGLALAAVVILGLGLLAAFYLLRRLQNGLEHSEYRRREAPADRGAPEARLPYLETALLFLIGVIVIGGLVGLAMASTGGQWLLLLNWLVVAVLFWPMARGCSWTELCRACGWHRGRGVMVEIGCGLLAYLAAVPILGFGLLLTLLLTRFTEQPPEHPIVDWLSDTGPGTLVVVFLLAIVWAPFVEESLFRGSLYHYARGRFGVVGSTVLVSLVFAAIHPQGLAGIPFLATLAGVLAATREWRDSLIASITLHMVHNGLATLLLVVLIS